MFKVKCIKSSNVSWPYFASCSNVSIINFEQVKVGWAKNLMRPMKDLKQKKWEKETRKIRRKESILALDRFLVKSLNPLSANPTKLSNTLKQFVGKVADELFECVWPFCGVDD